MEVSPGRCTWEAGLTKGWRGGGAKGGGRGGGVGGPEVVVWIRLVIFPR